MILVGIFPVTHAQCVMGDTDSSKPTFDAGHEKYYGY